MKLEMNGSTFRAYLNRELLFNVTDTSYASGKVGIYNNSSDSGRIYSYKLSPLD